jgi:phosphatidylserine decarboxylase
MGVRILKEGILLALPLIVIGAYLGVGAPFEAAVSFAVAGFILFFYRDPVRQVRPVEGAMLAPSDGTVLEIQEETSLLGETCWRVGVLLSVFDAHVNRSPIEATLVRRSYTKGKFLPAFLGRAGLRNERMEYNLIDKAGEAVLVTQVAGFLARRIVSFVKEGQDVAQGQKIGFIRFGSKVEVKVPGSYRLLVRKGQKLKAGKSVIAVREVSSRV